jgi:hypothetical protein
VLQYCASGANKFYLITTASQTVFQLDRSVAVEVCASRDNFSKIRNKKKPGRNGRAF